MRQPLDAVLGWPAAHVDLLLAFMAAEPPPEIGTEHIAAQAAARFFNYTSGKDAEPVTARDFLPAPWAPEPASPHALPEDERRMFMALASVRPREAT